MSPERAKEVAEKLNREDETLFLYLISQSKNNGYDTYDSAVVAASNEDEARYIHPGSDIMEKDKWWEDMSPFASWAHPDDVTVEKIGIVTSDIAHTIKKGVVCGSFNAG